MLELIMKKASVEAFQKAVPHLHILVIGDLMLDRYLWGKVQRISPEAPVPIVEVYHRENRPGGAANVALNVKNMGAKVSLCGQVGTDDEAGMLLEGLTAQGFSTELIRQSPDRITTTKTRVIGNRQQMLRVDNEIRSTIDEADTEALIAFATKDIAQYDAIIFEDYDKGLLSPAFIEAVIAAAKAANIPTVVDPKYLNFFAYAGCTVFKPNLKELNEALNLRMEKDDLEAVRQASQALRDQMPHNATLVTLSENGVIAIDKKHNLHHVPAHFRKIADVSGAGDTVIALISLAISAGLPLAEAAAIANLGGGLVCEEVGVVPVDPERLFSELDRLYGAE